MARYANWVVAVAAATLWLGTVSTAQAADRCSELVHFAMPGLAIKITKTEMLPPGPAPQIPFQPVFRVTLPAYCHVEGVLDERTGAGGRIYGVGFALALPENWNGRFLFQGGGGMDGFLLPPLGPTAAGDTPALARGFAVASTDSGHRSTGGGFDASFLADQKAAIDFEYASIGTVTRLAKQVVAAYFGKPASYSYFTGCSMGGREAMIAAQRYPLEFDGVISGAPAMQVGFSGIGDRYVSATLASLAPKGADGTPDISKEFSDADRKLVIDGLLEACDKKDGIADGMIFDVGACKFDPAQLACKTKKKTDRCLSAEQVAAIRKAFAGPKDSRGRQVYPGFYYDTGITAGGFVAGLLNVRPNPMGPPVFATEIDVDADAEQAENDPLAAIGDTAKWTNMSDFFGHGGKLIFFHGVSDPWFSAKDTVRYYERMAAANGGMDRVRTESSRLFLSPGMSHCGGGALDNFDLLTSLVDWVEQGKAPDSVVAKGQAFPGRTRPLCPWPQHAQYLGDGDSEDAKNFSCRD